MDNPSLDRLERVLGLLKRDGIIPVIPFNKLSGYLQSLDIVVPKNRAVGSWQDLADKTDSASLRDMSMKVHNIALARDFYEIADSSILSSSRSSRSLKPVI